MRMTNEMDYALRIMDCLAQNNQTEHGVSTTFIAEKTAVTQRFALKILHKLASSGLVISYKGANGGYSLARKPEEINLLSIIESVDGPIAINDCLSDGNECTCFNTDKSHCFYHHLLDDINDTIASKLRCITLKDALDGTVKKLKNKNI